ncbi:MAG: amino acid permease [Planctomycetota bacterium]|jgi:amino acid transporter
MPDSTSTSSISKARFGTFGGVFVPNVLTILGLIYFLRTGWVVGQLGLAQALIIVALANVISLLTGLSLSAVSTSMTVRTGGAYFILTRTLGLEVGGAIGIPLFASQAVSVAFYVIGFTTAVQAVAPGIAPYAPFISSGIVLAFGAMAWIGADFAIKLQYFVLAALLAGIVAFFFGGWDTPLVPILEPATGVVAATQTTEEARRLAEPHSFMAVFAVFFPAVTGIMVGASLSGDLKNPGKSIPRGTLLSIGFTAVIYIATTVWIGLNATREELLTDGMVMAKIAALPALKLVLIGVWTATLSSALGSVLAAPRTLQALASDHIVPRRLALQLGSKTEPRAAVLVTIVIAVAIVWAGDLNFVATLITMFFLSTYGFMNLAAGIERLVGNPSYRPKFNIPWIVSLLGAAGCFGAMLLIHWPATLVVVAISAGTFVMLERRSLKSEFGDVRSGIWATVARHSLLKLEGAAQQSKNWRPNVVCFTGQPRNREYLVEVGEWLTQGQGIVTFMEILVGNVEEVAITGKRDERRNEIRKFIAERNVNAFAECQIADDFFAGAITSVQSHGLAGLEPNTVLMGLSETPDGMVKQQELIPVFTSLGKSVLMLDYDHHVGYGQRKRIDVWWRGRSRNGELMLLLAHIVRSHRAWAGAKIRILQIAESEKTLEATRKILGQLVEEARVKASPKAVLRGEGESVKNLIERHSKDADLTIIGMQMPAPVDAKEIAERVHDMIQPLGSVMLVRSAETEDVLGGETKMILALPEKPLQ